MALSHIDKNNNPTMVDVSDKSETMRFAHAQCEVHLPTKVLSCLVDDEIVSPKGPVFQTAIVAGTMGLKKTSELIPFCHQLNIEGSSVEINIKDNLAIVDCTVRTCAKTGVEMEALTGANIAALTIYDMCKALSKDISIKNLYLVKKTGGKSDYESRK